MNQALLILVKNPIQGKVKTRLAATIGNVEALAVYQYLLQYTQTITSHLPLNKIVFYSDTIEEQDLWDNNIYLKKAQTGADLGERIANAFTYAFAQGNKEVAVIGSDCPELTDAIIRNTFVHLQNHDVVVGPAKDGGYYLLAMKKMYPSLLKDITWSTDKVLQQTLAACKKAHLSFYLLPELSDVDNENDLINIKETIMEFKMNGDL